MLMSMLLKLLTRGGEYLQVVLVLRYATIAVVSIFFISLNILKEEREDRQVLAKVQAKVRETLKERFLKSVSSLRQHFAKLDKIRIKYKS